MNNITSTLLTKHYDYNIEEWSKQGFPHRYDSGREQRITTSAIPATKIEISYRGLTETEFLALRTAYEANHSSTFICDFDSFIDKRKDFMTVNASVWIIENFSFDISARERIYSGRISLISSVFFNFTAYQDLFTQSSSYTRSASTDTSFTLLLEDAPFNNVTLRYSSNSLFSNIGQSARHIKDKGGLLKTWQLSWLLEQSDFLKLLTFYRKNAGIMGEFGMDETWTVAGEVTNARFMQDSFRYNANINGLYSCSADIIEVKI